MPSSGMLRRVGLVRTDVSEASIASIIRVKRVSELGTTLEVISNRSMLRRKTKLLVTPNIVLNSSSLLTQMMEELPSYETSVLTRAK
jgi:hypothetical protein